MRRNLDWVSERLVRFRTATLDEYAGGVRMPKWAANLLDTELPAVLRELADARAEVLCLRSELADAGRVVAKAQAWRVAVDLAVQAGAFDLDEHEQDLAAAVDALNG